MSISEEELRVAFAAVNFYKARGGAIIESDLMDVVVAAEEEEDKMDIVTEPATPPSHHSGRFKLDCVLGSPIFTSKNDLLMYVIRNSRVENNFIVFEFRTSNSLVSTSMRTYDSVTEYLMKYHIIEL